MNGENNVTVTVAPNVIPSEPCCAVLSLSPVHVEDDESTRVVVLDCLFYDGTCTATRLERRGGTRTMLQDAVTLLNHLAFVEGWWPHLCSLELKDGSTFDGLPKFATDLLVGNTTYYESHLGAVLKTKRIQVIKDSCRRRLTSKIDASGRDLWDVVERRVVRGYDVSPELMKHKEDVIRSVDEARSRKETWEDLFVRLNGCDVYANFSSQLIDFFEMTRLAGAVYVVPLPFEDDGSVSVVDASIVPGGSDMSDARNKRFEKVRILERKAMQAVYNG
jgi:hypothetical protein